MSEDTIAEIRDHPVWGYVRAEWRTEIGLDWDNPLARNAFAGNGVELEKGKPAFYELPSTYPVTIVQARYGGTYEGGQWLAFPCYPHMIHVKAPDWNASDIECIEFWHRVNEDPKTWIIGRGSDPELAYYALIARIKEAAE